MAYNLFQDKLNLIFEIDKLIVSYKKIKKPETIKENELIINV